MPRCIAHRLLIPAYGHRNGSHHEAPAADLCGTSSARGLDRFAELTRRLSLRVNRTTDGKGWGSDDRVIGKGVRVRLKSLVRRQRLMTILDPLTGDLVEIQIPEARKLG